MSRENQMDLFYSSESAGVSVPSPADKSIQAAPMAARARPTQMDQFFGQKKLFERYPFLSTADFPSLIFWGPAGTGKTTLAGLLAQQSGKDFFRFNAVLGGVNDLKKLINRSLEIKQQFRQESIIFIDEIHRFNKAQQDALLPYVEEGAFTLIGATTENPRSSVNNALLSRVHMIKFEALTNTDIWQIIESVNQRFEVGLGPAILEFIANTASGDARKALNVLDVIDQQRQRDANFSKNLTEEMVKKLILENVRNYDSNQDRHYDVISAYIKSMRGSDPQAALLWLAVMLDGGEDPTFIARRLVIFASEDVGNADPSALTLACSALQVVAQIGMPEARISLAQATTYLASTYKSNAAYKGINEALEYVQSHPTIEVPNNLRNHHPEPYLYPHNYPDHYVAQKYTQGPIPSFYRPTQMGREKFLNDRLELLEKAGKSI